MKPIGGCDTDVARVLTGDFPHADKGFTPCINWCGVDAFQTRALLDDIHTAQAVIRVSEYCRAIGGYSLDTVGYEAHLRERASAEAAASGRTYGECIDAIAERDIRLFNDRFVAPADQPIPFAPAADLDCRPCNRKDGRHD
jgi:hypothetical protein